jgi:hypothetical protein
MLKIYNRTNNDSILIDDKLGWVMVNQELIEPSFKSSTEIAEERQDKQLLEALTTLRDESVRRLKVG